MILDTLTRKHDTDTLMLDTLLILVINTNVVLSTQSIVKTQVVCKHTRVSTHNTFEQQQSHWDLKILKLSMHRALEYTVQSWTVWLPAVDVSILMCQWFVVLTHFKCINDADTDTAEQIMILDTFLYQDTYRDTCIIDTPQHCLQLTLNPNHKPQFCKHEPNCKDDPNA